LRSVRRRGPVSVRWAQYGWALFYLGNDVDASRHNQVGVAFANDPAGPWTRMARPIITHDDDKAWGAGQPSAVNIGRGGRVLLFYTQGDRDGTRVLLREVDLSDVRNDRVPSAPPVRLSTNGLTGTDGRPDILNNADFALHPKSRRLYVVREQHPNPPDRPAYIGASSRLPAFPWRRHGVARVRGALLERSRPL
jgi:hypothetical protein